MIDRDHYQRAFEEYVRLRRIPYVSVDEARRAILPDASPLKVETGDGAGRLATLKSFDFVVYAPGSNLLVEVKGRKVAARRSARSAGGGAGAERGTGASKRAAASGGRGSGSAASSGDGSPGLDLLDPGPALARPPRTRLESWVTRDDVESLRTWEGLFGPGFTAVFAFVYWCEAMPPGALFEEYVERDGRWYAIRCVERSAYASAMKVRSPRWGTVHVPPVVFDRLCRPLVGGRGDGTAAGLEA
ncbi:MAG: HYExAFE family protein [Phycisphaerales bacterium]